jgi:tetratricopeptide (TPR) repeat protein
MYSSNCRLSIVALQTRVSTSGTRALRCRRRARKRRPTHISRGSMPPQGAHLLSLANTRLVSGELQEAQKLLLDCIKLYPNFTEPYMSLVAVFKELGQGTKALHLYALALHMKPSDTTIALECAKLSTGAQLSTSNLLEAETCTLRLARTQGCSASAGLQRTSTLVTTS